MSRRGRRKGSNVNKTTDGLPHGKEYPARRPTERNCLLARPSKERTNDMGWGGTCLKSYKYVVFLKEVFDSDWDFLNTVFSEYKHCPGVKQASSKLLDFYTPVSVKSPKQRRFGVVRM